MCSKERRLSNITPRFLTLSSICRTVSSIVIWKVSVRLLKFGVAKIMHWVLFEFIFKLFSLNHSFIVFRLVSAYIFNCSTLLGEPLDKSRKQSTKRGRAHVSRAAFWCIKRKQSTKQGRAHVSRGAFWCIKRKQSTKQGRAHVSRGAFWSPDKQTIMIY